MGAVDVVVNAANVWSAARPLVASRNKALMGSIDETELRNRFPFVTDTNLYKSLIWVSKLYAPIIEKTISKLFYNSCCIFMDSEYFYCPCLWKTVYQYYFTSLVDTLMLSIALHSSFHQILASVLQDSVIVANNQAKFRLSEDNQLKSIP